MPGISSEGGTNMDPIQAYLETKKNGDGSLELTFRVAGLDEIKWWILSFDPEAQILEPAKLREMIRIELQKSLGQYTAHRISYDLVREPQA